MSGPSEHGPVFPAVTAMAPVPAFYHLPHLHTMTPKCGDKSSQVHLDSGRLGHGGVLKRDRALSSS